MVCGLVNLGSCLTDSFFQFLLNVLNAPIRPFLQLTLNLLSEPVNLDLFVSMWAIIIYLLSMFYALFILFAGFNFMISGYDPAKREKAKEWLRNIMIMIVLIQSSYFIYQLVTNLSSIMTSATLTLIDPNFFLIGTNGINDLGISLLFSFAYISTLILTSIILVIRYAFVVIGVILLPIAIFFYFIPPLKQYGSLIMNFLGISIFITFFDSIMLAGFSKLVNVGIFGSMKIIVLISAFIFISVIMLLLLLFSIVKAGLNVYTEIKRFKI